jgi:hypothetical protein
MTARWVWDTDSSMEFKENLRMMHSRHHAKLFEWVTLRSLLRREDKGWGLVVIVNSALESDRIG